MQYAADKALPMQAIDQGDLRHVASSQPWRSPRAVRIRQTAQSLDTQRMGSRTLVGCRIDRTAGKRRTASPIEANVVNDRILDDIAISSDSRI